MDSVHDDLTLGKSTEKRDTSPHHREVTRNEDSLYGLNADLDFLLHQLESFSDTLLWLKSFAVDHYMEDTSTKNFKERRGQILKAKNILYDTRSRKRKLQQLLQERATAASELSMKKPKKPSPAKYITSANAGRSSDQIQNPHCSIRSSNFVDNLSQKRIPNSHSFPPDSLVVDVDSDDTTKSRKHMHTSPSTRFSPRHKPDGFVNGSHTLKFNNAKTQTSPQKLCNFFGDDDLVAIPVGPRFQAEIPEIITAPNGNSPTNGCTNSVNSDKWLGTLIWPIKSIAVNNSTKNIGKGRPSSCSCHSQGSVQCINLHVTEKKLQLQVDLSSAFYRWQFDKMGEDVSKSWTPNEQEQLRNLVRLNPVSDDRSFWKPAIKCFPSKSRASIVSYYFNVFVLRRMRRQTRLASEVDSDDDEFDEGAGHSKDAKQRYLTSRR